MKPCIKPHPVSVALLHLRNSTGCSAPDAFTRFELVVVLAVLALLAMFLLPALARTQPDSRAFQCLNNHRQLARAWLMYAADNNDQLATSLHGSEAMSPTQPMWAAGWLDWGTSSANTNTVYLTDPRYSILANYLGRNARLFKCPADHYLSSVQRNLLGFGWKERARSVAQNLYAANGNATTGPSDPAYLQVRNLTGLVNPKPAETWVSIDEHPDSINDGVLFPPSLSAWVDVPGNYHDGSAGVAFADGHVEMHRWQASLLNVPIRFFFQSVNVQPNDPDMLWLRYRTPRPPGVN
jgi:prepilin-type processing-associated H-X9-DG protein